LNDSDAPVDRSRFDRTYVIAFAIGAAILSVLPNLYGQIAAPPGSVYQGFQWAADDHYVYAAWMRQAMDGRLLMDNRFTTDSQPGLTINLYFFVIGLIAKAVGIPVAMALAKMAFSALFVFLAHRLIGRITSETFTKKLALAFVVLGQGVGFLVWENFGPEFERPSPFAAALRAIGVPGVPNDVWQPEAFTFPSMLTNGLFMVSLCLIVGVFICFLDAKSSWKPVLPGFLMIGLLMNIHSYDVLLIGLVMAVLLGMQISRRDVDLKWVARSTVIGLGAILPALWFLNVLSKDAVFRERAATPTYSPNFKVFLFGYAILIFLAALSALRSPNSMNKARIAGSILASVLIVGLYTFSPSNLTDSYFLTLPVWIALFAAACVSCALLATSNPAANLAIAWGIAGLIIPYFPALFQRKLTMGLNIPWAILAAIGLAAVIIARERSKRNLVTALTILIIGGTSLRWFFREIELVRLNVSNTTVHSVHLTRDVQSILSYLDQAQGSGKRTVVMALPGVAQKDPELPDSFREPLIPDLNPVLSGLAGVYTYAGHWSETPHYIERRNECTEVFLAQTTPERRNEIVTKSGADYLVTPDPAAFPGIADLSYLGDVVAGGNQYRLIRLNLANSPR
jgi:hypothetical protein